MPQTEFEDTTPVPVRAVALRRRRRWWWRVTGTGLVVWGVIGLVLLGLFFKDLASPLSELNNLSGSVEDQRTAALQSLAAARDTISQTGAAVRGMDTSLADAKAATDRSSAIALSVSDSMNQLAGQMSLTIFGLQPLIGLSGAFTSSASQLTELSTDLTTIGAALDSNRNDALSVATSLDALGVSLDRLRDAVANGPHLDQATKALDTVRLGILSLLIWLGVLAVGSILAGLGCWVVARGP